MRMSILASGSKGNSTFVEVNNTRMLIDAGGSGSYIMKKLKEIDIDPKTIKNILITHTHNDHINGLAAFYNKYKPTVYIMPSMIKDLNKIIGDFKYELYKSSMMIDDVSLKVIKTSHDTEDSVGFLIDDKLVYITDTGYLNSKYFELLKNKGIYVIESNHDIEMLIDGKYYHHLKQRILSDKGHLSNKAASGYLSKLIGDKTKYIFLAHLSADNNTSEKAMETLLTYINPEDVHGIIVTNQHDRTELVEV